MIVVGDHLSGNVGEFDSCWGSVRKKSCQVNCLLLTSSLVLLHHCLLDCCWGPACIACLNDFSARKSLYESFCTDICSVLTAHGTDNDTWSGNAAKIESGK